MDEAWIQQSLARLEALEAYKAQVEASGQAVDLTEVDSEIAALYEVLESAAGADEAPAAPQPQTAYFGPSAPAQEFAPASPGQAPGYAPPISPAMPPPVATPSFDADMSYSDMDVDEPRSKAPLLAIGALAVVGLCAGGWFVVGAQETEEAVVTQPASDPKVISASAVPEDTQEPEVAQGGDADRTKGTIYKKSNRPAPLARRGGGGGGGGGGTKAAPRKRKAKKDSGHKINTISKSRDPLAGLK